MQKETKKPSRRAPTRREPVPFWERFACTLQDAEDVSGLGQTMLYGLIADGTLESVKVRRRRLVIVSSLRRLLFGDNAEAA